MTDKEIMQKAIATYGTPAQVDMAIEEMSELTKALLKYRRKGVSASITDIDSIIDEMADVEIMLAQLKIIYSIDESELMSHKISKLKRLQERLEGKK